MARQPLNARAEAGRAGSGGTTIPQQRTSWRPLEFGGSAGRVLATIRGYELLHCLVREQIEPTIGKSGPVAVIVVRHAVRILWC